MAYNPTAVAQLRDTVESAMGQARGHGMNPAEIVDALESIGRSYIHCAQTPAQPTPAYTPKTGMTGFVKNLADQIRGGPKKQTKLI